MLSTGALHPQVGEIVPWGQKKILFFMYKGQISMRHINRYIVYPWCQNFMGKGLNCLFMGAVIKYMLRSPAVGVTGGEKQQLHAGCSGSSAERFCALSCLILPTVVDG